MNRKNGRKYGEVYTKLGVVQYILDEVGFRADKNLKEIKLLEPSSGTGAFANEIITRLLKSSKKYTFDFTDALIQNIRFVEKDTNSYNLLKENIIGQITSLGLSAENINECFINADYLKCDFLPKFNCIVGNPPYVRHEYIDAESKLYYKRNFPTFKFRADLYIPFFEKSLNLLSNKGKLSFICSNRWLYNQYGQFLREKIATEFYLEKLLNIEKTSPFDEEVIGYPCITTIANSKGIETLYFETDLKEIDLKNISFNVVATPLSSAWQNIFLDYNINQEYLKSITEQGYSIGIGVATGSDSIFIKKKTELKTIESTRLLPIIRSNALKGNEISWDENYIINPFENDTLCDLDNYQGLKDYFEENRTVLEKRHIAKKNSKSWFKTIDKIKPELIKQPKILLPDLAGCKYLFIDKGDFYPHHNVYYITHHEINKLKILASILMSTFVKDQLSQIGIRMNGGLPRFQSQTLKKLRIPDINKLKKKEKQRLIESYDNKQIELINEEIEIYRTRYII